MGTDETLTPKDFEGFETVDDALRRQLAEKDAEIDRLKDSVRYDAFLREKYRKIILEFIDCFEKASAKSAAWDGNRLLLGEAREVIK